MDLETTLHLLIWGDPKMGGTPIFFQNWLLVGGFTPWKIWVRQLGWLFPLYGITINVPNHQPGLYLVLKLKQSFWGSPILGNLHLPSGKLSHNYGKIHHFSWENSLFLWPFSIAMLNCQRVSDSQVIEPLSTKRQRWSAAALQNLQARRSSDAAERSQIRRFRLEKKFNEKRPMSNRQ